MACVPYDRSFLKTGWHRAAPMSFPCMESPRRGYYFPDFWTASPGQTISKVPLIKQEIKIIKQERIIKLKVLFRCGTR